MFRACSVTVGALALFSLAVLAGTPAMAGKASVAADGTVTWQAGIDGVETQWNANGSIRRISAKAITDVEFPDRRGIITAQIIAEEKAKAKIVRYLKQAVASSRIVTQIENDLQKATLSTGSHEHKINQRTLITNLTEITGSFASGTLRGVMLLEKGYDPKTQEAWAVVGISRKSIRGAAQIERMMNGPANGADSSADTSAPAHARSDAQPGEVLRLNEKNW